MMKGLMIFSNGMEDSEALSTLALLRRANMDMTTTTKEANLEVKTAFGVLVKADKHLSKIDAKDYDFLIIPGGGYVGDVIDHADYIKDLIKGFRSQDKDLYAICAAPRFLGRLGLLDDLDYTAFPGSEKDAQNGNYLGHKKVVVTPKIITARSAGAVTEFVYEIVKKNKGENSAKALINNIMYWILQIEKNVIM